jgi:hypothetical protein
LPSRNTSVTPPPSKVAVFQAMLVQLNLKMAVAFGVRVVLPHPPEAGVSAANVQFPYCVFSRSLS